jgi:acetyl esterase/lipase
MTKIIVAFLFLIPTFLYSKSYKSFKNISYANTPSVKKETLLDVFAPKDRSALKEVFIFIHGGSWVSGNKNTYHFLGKKMAAKGKVAVIINYPLAHAASISQIEMSCAQAVKWCYEHIEEYGGNKNKIFVSGHSAGGHLAAMLSVNNNLFDSLGIKNPVKGCVLIDAFGLDMFTYLGHITYSPNGLFFKIFSGKSQTWKLHSPIYHIENKTPFLIYVGGKTFPAIKSSNADFNAKLKKKNINSEFKEIKNRGHIAMIFQLYFRRNKMYGEILELMN